jgi:hypothetical protein
VVDSIAGVTIAAAEPDTLAARWAELDIDEAVRFVGRDQAGPPVDGIVEIALHAIDRERVGELHDIGGVRLELV